MYIADRVAEDIKSRVQIEEVIADYLDLKPKGGRFWACCPFHSEKTPSFSVVPHMGIYKCFGCGKGGDAISFLQEIDSLSYTEALLYLAKRYQIEIKYKDSSAAQESTQKTKEGLHALMSFAESHYVDRLHHHKEGQALALRYLESRAIHPPTLHHFSIGYALASGKDLLHTTTQKGYTSEQLKEAGLIQQHSPKDLFVERVLFPIHNLSGHVIAFGARSMKQSEPKYLNSPETPIYHKHQVLYGLYQARQAIRKTTHAYLVEGYMDVLSMVQSGYEETIAIAGTALTESQARLLARFASSVTLLFDGDSAGHRAALRAIDLLLGTGIDVFVLPLPDGSDPDSFLRKEGKEGFDEYAKKKRVSFLSFKRSQLQAKDLSPQAEARSVRELLGSIALIPDEIAQYTLLHQCSKELQIPEDILRKTFLELRRPSPQNEPPPDPLADSSSNDQALEPIHKQEAELLKMLLLYGAEFEFLIPYVLSEIKELNLKKPSYEALRLEIQKGLNKEKRALLSELFSHPEPRIRESVQSLLPKEEPLSTLSVDQLQEMAKCGIIRLKRAHVGQMIQENIHQLQAISSSSSSAEEEALLRTHQQLKHLYEHLSRLLESVVFAC